MIISILLNLVNKKIITKIAGPLCFLLLHAAISKAQPPAIQVFTATDGMVMDRRPGHLSMDNDGMMWLGSRNGLFSFDGFYFKRYALPDSLLGGMPQNIVFNFQDSEGKYWVHVKQKGLYIFDPVQSSFKAFILPPALKGKYGLDSMNMLYPFEDAKKRIWFCQAFHGMLRVESKTGNADFFPIEDSTRIDPWVSATNVSSMLEINGLMYLASNNGIVEMNPETGGYAIYNEPVSKSATNSSCLLIRLLKGNNPNEIICSSWGNGIKIYNTATHHFSTYLLASNDRPNQNIIIDAARINDSLLFCAKRDSAGQTGFVLFNINSGKYTLLKNIEPYYTWREYGFFVRRGDFVWLPNISQLYRFYLPALTATDPSRELMPAGIHQQLSITASGIFINGILNPVNSKELTLPAGENTLRLQYACLGATRQDSLLFMYRLQGFDKDWKYDREPIIQYSNLPHGRYTLLIRVARSAYASHVKEFAMNISIAGYWWQSTWFKVITAVFIFFLFYALYHFRVRQIQKEAILKTNYEKQVAEMEMKALRAQMNPHFIFNCLNSINKYIVKEDHKTASGYLTRFSKLVRLILDNSSSDIISVQTETETLDLYLQMESMRFHHNFDYSIRVNGISNAETIYIPSMLIQPYVENAIWHGLMHKKDGRGILQLIIERHSDEMLSVIIEDNGIGRQQAGLLKKEALYNVKSYGMQITGNRIRLISDIYKTDARVSVVDLADENKRPAGTKVALYVPVIRRS